MNTTMKTVLALAALVAAPVMATSASASTLVIGAPGDSGNGNCFPFGCAGTWPPEYQQVYASSDFTGPIKIKDLEFYNYNVPDGSPNGGTYTISLSATSAAVNGLDLSNLANNIGANNTTVFTGTLPALSSGVLHIDLSTAFTYNPAGGNLLMDVVGTGLVSNGNMFLDARNRSAGGLFSRAMSGGSGFNDYGLVTGFSTTTIPEPSTWAMMALGFAGLGFAGFRRTRKERVAAIA